MNVMAKALEGIRLQAKLATLRNNNPLFYEPNPTLPFTNSYFPADVSSSLVAAGFLGHSTRGLRAVVTGTWSSLESGIFFRTLSTETTSPAAG